MHSAATVHAADKLITPQGDLNANWFSILTVEGVAVQLHTANIKPGDTAGRTCFDFLLFVIDIGFLAKPKS